MGVLAERKSSIAKAARPASRKALATLAALTLAASLAPAPATAQAPSLEYAVKANFLYKFGPFVAWPPQAFATAGAPFNVCLLGEDPFGAALDAAVRGQTVGGHPVAVHRLQTVGRFPACHVLYIGRSAQPRTEVLQLMRGAPVLTVTDERLGPARGLVHFVIRQGRVRFTLDAAGAQSSGLAISSKLLQLSVSPGDGGPS